MISYRVTILEKHSDGVLAKVDTKEALTYGTEPHQGDTFFFSGSYNSENLRIGDQVILRAHFTPPNERKDDYRVEMKIAEILPNRFDSLRTDLWATILGVSFVFLTVLLVVFLKTFKKNKKT